MSFRNISCDPQPLYEPLTGVRDPSILYWQDQWYMVHSYGESVTPLVFLAKFSDLLHWTRIGSLRLAVNIEDNNFIAFLSCTRFYLTFRLMWRNHGRGEERVLGPCWGSSVGTFGSPTQLTLMHR